MLPADAAVVLPPQQWDAEPGVGFAPPQLVADAVQDAVPDLGAVHHQQHADAGSFVAASPPRLVADAV